MTTNTTTSIRTQLLSIRRLIRRRQLVAASIMTLGLLATGVLLIDAVNHCFPLREQWAFFLTALLAVVAIGTWIWRGVAAHLRAPTPADLALAVERQRPEFLDALVCAVETEAKRPQERRTLEAALVDNVVSKTRNFDFGAAVFPAPLRWPRQFLLACLFASLAAGALRTQGLAKARLYLHDLVRGAASGLLVAPGNTEVAEHQDLRITAAVRRWTDKAEIVYTDHTGTHRFIMNRQEAGTHTFTFYGLTETVRYRVTTPALASPWFLVETYRPPALRQAVVRLEAPAYTGRKPTTLPELRDCRAVAGTRVRLDLDVDPDVDAVCERDGIRTNFHRSGAENRTHTFQLQNDTAYRILLRNPRGRTAATDVHRVTVEPDLPPLVEVLSPRGDAQIKCDQSLVLEARASDDFGLQQVTLSFSVSGGPQRDLALLSTSSPASPNISMNADATGHPAAELPDRQPNVLDKTLTHTLCAQELGLREGDVVSCVFRARDARTPEPQVGRSDVFFIVVRPTIDPEDANCAAAEARKLDISGLIAESKRLIRMTWDTISAASPERPPLESELLRGLRDLRLETQRKFNEIVELAGTAGNPLAQLLAQAAAEVGTAENLLTRRLLREALPPQERALAHMIALENELLKNTARSRQSQGEQSDSDSDPRETREPPRKNQQDAEAKREAMREWLRELRELASRQHELNREIERRDRESERTPHGPELARKQRTVRAETRTLSDRLRPAQENETLRAVQAAETEMGQAADRLERRDLQLGHRRGRRAHTFLLAAIRELEESYKDASANVIAQLAQQTGKLADAQRQAATRSRTLAARNQTTRADSEDATQQQQTLNQAADDLHERISRTAAELEDDFPDAAQAVTDAALAARRQELAAKMTRAANALLYRRFGKARSEQTDAANVLLHMAAQLRQAARKLPAVSRDELLEALAAMRANMEQVHQAARTPDETSEQRLESIREQAARQLDPLAAALQDPAMSRIAQQLALPLGDAGSAQGSRQLLTLFRAAQAVLERHLFTGRVEKRSALSRRTSAPPEKYRRLVEQYFKDLSRTR